MLKPAMIKLHDRTPINWIGSGDSMPKSMMFPPRLKVLHLESLIVDLRSKKHTVASLKTLIWPRESGISLAGDHSVRKCPPKS